MLLLRKNKTWRPSADSVLAHHRTHTLQQHSSSSKSSEDFSDLLCQTVCVRAGVPLPWQRLVEQSCCGCATETCLTHVAAGGIAAEHLGSNSTAFTPAIPSEIAHYESALLLKQVLSLKKLPRDKLNEMKTIYLHINE